MELLKIVRNISNFFKGKDHRKALGGRGEEAALRYLRSKGLHLIEQNWRCNIGELDLILTDGKVLIIVEVKTRYESCYASRHLLDNITRSKQRKLRSLALIYHRLNGKKLKRMLGVNELGLRIDVVGVIMQRNYSVTSIRHLQGCI